MPETDPVEQIRDALDVASAVRSQASDWQSDSGGDRKARCTHPEHGHTSGNSDGSRNMIVTNDDGWYCYSHETGGGIFEWVAVEEGICGCRNLPLDDEQFKETLRVAADRAGVDLTPDDVDYEDLSDERKAQHALDSALDILHDNLDTVVDGTTIRHKLIQERGFDNDTIDEARIGYIDDQAHAELLEELSNEALQSIGLHSEDDNLRIRNRIVYPYEKAGLPEFWIARRTEQSPKSQKYDKAPSSCDLSQPIYTHDPSDPRQSDDVWVVEGIQDAISTAEEGNVRAISAVATNPSTEQTNQLIEEAGKAGRVVVCFDNDDSGVKKATDLAVKLMRTGVQTDIAFVPDGDDPNDFFKAGGMFAQLDPQPAAREIIEQRGETTPVLEEVCSTVEPNTPRADRIVESLSEVTSCQKRTLRKLVREQYRYEEQQGWIEPVKVEKTSGADTEWTFIFPDGTEITLDNIRGRRTNQEFCNKYAAAFNFLPDIDADEWVDQVNEWLQEVAVTEVDPLSPEGLARENVVSGLNKSDVSTTWKDALTTPHIRAGFDGDDTILVESEAIDEWTDDDYHLRKISEYLDPIMSGTTVNKRVDDQHQRMWPLSVEAIEAEGLPVPEPTESPDMAPSSDGDVEDEGVEEL